jgi:LysR family hydrogen peroxide-inducible transcriptional activator
VQLADLDSEKLLLLEEGHCLRGQALDFCKQADIAENDLRATSLETLKQMVRLGNGITLVPKLACSSSDGVVYRPFKMEKPSRTIALVWRKTSTKQAVIKVLTGVLRTGQRDKLD